MKKIPLHNRQKEVIAYALVDDEDYPLVSQFRWHLARGYAVRTIYLGGGRKRPKFTTEAMSRVITGAPKGMEVDHKFHITLDNRRSQLRVCEKRENRRNSRKYKGTHPYKGLSRRKDSKKWHAAIRFRGKLAWLGSYDTAEDAAIAYNVAAQIFYGEYACLNPV